MGPPVTAGWSKPSSASRSAAEDVDGDINLDAYFTRIGYRGAREPTLEVLSALHLAHPAAIPFESLDPLLGRPVLLDAPSLEAKLVRSRRGGYCFEQNGVFLRVLRQLGFAVTPLSARVRWMLPPDAPPTSLSHMMLRLDLPLGPYICDVGFGGQSPTAPLRVELDVPQETPHGDYRLTAVGNASDLQLSVRDRWETLYRFTEEPRFASDYMVSNWFTSTHPQSRFTNNLVASRVVGSERLNLFNTGLTIHRKGAEPRFRALPGPLELHAVLTQDFGLDVAPAVIEGVFPRLPAAGPS